MEALQFQTRFNDIPRKFFFEITTENGKSPNNLFLNTSQQYSFLQKFLNLQNLSLTLKSKIQPNIPSEIKKEFMPINSSVVFFIDEKLNKELIIMNCLNKDIDIPLIKNSIESQNIQNILSHKNILSEEDFLKSYYLILEENYLKFNPVNCIKQVPSSVNYLDLNTEYLIANKKMESDLLFQILCRHEIGLTGFEEFENWSIRNSLPTAMDFILEQNIITDITSERYLGNINLYISNLPDDPNLLSQIMKTMNFKIETDGQKSKVYLDILNNRFPALEAIHECINKFNIFWDKDKLEDIFNLIIYISCLARHLNSPQKIVRVRNLCVLFFEKVMFNGVLKGVLSNIQLEMNNPINQSLLTMLIAILSVFRFSFNFKTLGCILETGQLLSVELQKFLTNFTMAVIQKLSEGFFVDYQILIVYLICICEGFDELRDSIFTPNFIAIIHDFFTKNKNPRAALKIATLMLSAKFGNLNPNVHNQIHNLLILFIIDYKEDCKYPFYFVIVSTNSLSKMSLSINPLLWKCQRTVYSRFAVSDLKRVHTWYKSLNSDFLCKFGE